MTAKPDQDYYGIIREQFGISYFTDITVQHPNSYFSITFNISDDEEKEERERIELVFVGHPDFPDHWGEWVGFHNRIVQIERSDQGFIGFNMEEAETELIEGGDPVELTILVQDMMGDPFSTPDSLEFHYEFFEEDGRPTGEIRHNERSSGTFTIPPRTTEYKLPITAIADGESEPDERIKIRLKRVTSTIPAWEVKRDKSTHTIVVPANENVVHFASPDLTPLSEVTLQEEETTHTILVRSLTAPPVEGLPLRIAVESHPTLADLGSTDYTFTTTEFMMTRDDPTYELSFALHEDSEGEYDEGIRLRLSKGENFPDEWGDIFRNQQGEIQDVFDITVPANDNTIAFADAGPTTLMEIDNTETSKRGALEILLDQPVPQQFLLDVVVTDENGDLLQEVASDLGGAKSRTTLTVPAMARSVMLPVWAYNDNIAEAEKRATITISSTTNANLTRGWTFSRATHEVVLAANDNKVGFAVCDWQVSCVENIDVEEDFGTLDIEIKLTTPAPARGLPLAFERVSTIGGMSADDYTLDTSPFVVPANETTYNIPLTINNDALEEGVEGLVIVLEEGENFPTDWGSLIVQQITVSIPANDSGTIGFVGNAATVDERLGENVIHRIDIDLDRPAPDGGLQVEMPIRSVWAGDITVEVSPPEWWNSSTHVLNIPKDEMGADVVVTIIDDTVIEYEAEEFVFNLVNAPVGWKVMEPSYTLTVPPNDRTIGLVNDGTTGPVVGVPLVFSEFRRSYVWLPIEVVGGPRSAEESFNLLVEVVGNDDGDLVGADGVSQSPKVVDTNLETYLSFDPDIMGVDVAFDVVNDTLLEGDEEIVVRLVPEGGSLPEGWRWSSGQQVTVKIRTSDNLLSFAATGSEMDISAGSEVEVALTLTNPAPEDGLDITIVADDSQDQILSIENDGALNIPAGETGATFKVELLYNLVAGSERDVTLTLTSDDIDFKDPNTSTLFSGSSGAFWGSLEAGASHTVRIRAQEEESETPGTAGQTSSPTPDTEKTENPREASLSP